MGALISLKHDVSVTTDMHGGCTDLAASKTAFAVEEEVTFWWNQIIDIGSQRRYAATHDGLREGTCT